jgi:hypothetical protein
LSQGSGTDTHPPLPPIAMSACQITVTGLDQDSQNRLLDCPGADWGGRGDSTPFLPPPGSSSCLRCHATGQSPCNPTVLCLRMEQSWGDIQKAQTEGKPPSARTQSQTMDHGKLTGTLRHAWAWPQPAPTPCAQTHALTHTLLLTGTALLIASCPLSTPEPLTWAKHSAPQAEQPPAQGWAAGGAGKEPWRVRPSCH